MKYIAVAFCVAALISSSAQAQQQPMPDLNKMFKEHNNAPKTPPSQQDTNKIFESMPKNAEAQKAALSRKYGNGATAANPKTGSESSVQRDGGE